MNFIKKYKSTILTVLIISFAVSALAFWVKNQSKYAEIRYDLEEIDSGIYARYYQVHSPIPAQNYEVVEICINGNIYTYNGDVLISYINETPCAVIQNHNIVQRNQINLFVPKGTVEYLESGGLDDWMWQNDRESSNRKNEIQNKNSNGRYG